MRRALLLNIDVSRFEFYTSCSKIIFNHIKIVAINSLVCNVHVQGTRQLELDSLSVKAVNFDGAKLRLRTNS